MAAVGAVYMIEPFVRTADDVIEEVMREEGPQVAAPARRRQTGARGLLVGKVALFLWLADEVIRRNPQGNKPVIFLSDGEKMCLYDRQSEYLPENTVCILDFVHVMERLWEVAWRSFRRAGPEAQNLRVWNALRRLLEGKVDAVIRGMRYQSNPAWFEGTRGASTVAGVRRRFRAESRLDEGIR